MCYPHEIKTIIIIIIIILFTLEFAYRSLLLRFSLPINNALICKESTLFVCYTKVRIWKTQEDIRTAEDFKTDKRTEVVINNLQRQVVYVMRVLGYSIGGEGSKSPHVYFTVGGKSVD